MDARPITGRVAHRPSPGHDGVEDASAVASVAVTLLGLPMAVVIDAEAYVAQAVRSEAALSIHPPAPPHGVAPRDGAVHESTAGGAVRPRVDHAGLWMRPPGAVEGAVVLAVAITTGSGIALGGAVALGYVLVRSAHARIRDHLKTEWAAVGPGRRTSA